MISVQVRADEAIFRLDQVPRKLRAILLAKYQSIFDQIRGDLRDLLPGKYLDSEQVRVGVEELGSTIVGFAEYSDKMGKYPIVPKSAAFLQFRAKDGAWVRTNLVLHPFPKGVPFVEAYLAAQKPWIVRQLSESVDEANL